MIPVFIPARSKSVSVPDKNMRLLKGKPLLQWAIEAAQKSARVDQHHIFVSTDSPKYGKFAEDLGVNWIRRPPELAEDVPTEDVILHALDIAENQTGQDGAVWHYDPIVTLQCTTPLMDPLDIDQAVEVYKANESIYNSVITVTNCRDNPLWLFGLEGLHLKPFVSLPIGNQGIRQKLPKLFKPNGAVYVTKREFLKTKKSLLGEPVGFHWMPLERSWEVDEEMDLKILEALA